MSQPQPTVYVVMVSEFHDSPDWIDSIWSNREDAEVTAYNARMKGYHAEVESWPVNPQKSPKFSTLPE